MSKVYNHFWDEVQTTEQKVTEKEKELKVVTYIGLSLGCISKTSRVFYTIWFSLFNKERVGKDLSKIKYGVTVLSLFEKT